MSTVTPRAGGPRPPLVVVDDPAVLAAVTAEITGAAWTVHPAGTATGPFGVVSMPVATRAEAQAALLIALGGSGLLVSAGPRPEQSVTDHSGAERPSDVLDDLVEDLGRIAPVRLPDATTAVRLDPDTWRLLHALADGATVAVAAESLHLSMRTANRRITEARTALGAQSRAQLLRALSAPDRIPAAGLSR